MATRRISELLMEMSETLSQSWYRMNEGRSAFIKILQDTTLHLYFSGGVLSIVFPTQRLFMADTCRPSVLSISKGVRRHLFGSKSWLHRFPLSAVLYVCTTVYYTFAQGPLLYVLLIKIPFRPYPEERKPNWREEGTERASQSSKATENLFCHKKQKKAQHCCSVAWEYDSQ